MANLEYPNIAVLVDPLFAARKEGETSFLLNVIAL
jgi:hypothetical protein